MIMVESSMYYVYIILLSSIYWKEKFEMGLRCVNKSYTRVILGLNLLILVAFKQ